MKRKIAIFGSTGSIGINALDVIKNLGEEKNIYALTANRNVELLAKQIRQFKPEVVVLRDINYKNKLEKELKNLKYKPEVLYGDENLINLGKIKEIDFVLMGLVGMAGLLPTISCIESRKRIALSTKEVLVMAGEIIMNLAHQRNVEIIPIDSEHSAIFQCLKEEPIKSISKVILTASGGPFYKRINLKNISIKSALKHPIWKMGKKTTIDSATLMNKGLEVIEAHYLFNIPLDKIEVVIHPQSIIHSFVEFIDGSILAQFAPADIRIPIQYAFTYPQRKFINVRKLDFDKINRLNFVKFDPKKFPCFELAIKAIRKGGTMPAVMSVADEVAVERFLEGRIKFSQIPDVIEKVMQKHCLKKNPSIEDILEVSYWSKQQAEEEINKC